MSRPPYPCPGCGFEVFSEPAGSYEICSICGWEDDHVQLANPGVAIGANHESLYDWQRELINEIPQELTEWRGKRRAKGWRPVTESECKPRASQEGPRSGYEYFLAAASDSPSYYWEED